MSTNTHVISAWRQGSDKLCVRLNKTDNQPVVDALNNGRAIHVTWQAGDHAESATITGMIGTGVTKRKAVPYVICTITGLDGGQSVKAKRAGKAKAQPVVNTQPVATPTVAPEVEALKSMVAQLTAQLVALTGNTALAPSMASLAPVVTPAPTGLVLPAITKPKRQAPVLSDEAKAKRDAGLVKARAVKAAKQAAKEAEQVATIKAERNTAQERAAKGLQITAR